eukprot:6196349-Pleurochrysis_carterae.AAC.4
MIFVLFAHVLSCHPEAHDDTLIHRASCLSCDGVFVRRGGGSAVDNVSSIGHFWGFISHTFTVYSFDYYVLTLQKRVVVASKDHATAVFHRIDPTYPLHSPLPVDFFFDLTISSLPAAIQTRARTTAAATSADGSPSPTSLSSV